MKIEIDPFLFQVVLATDQRAVKQNVSLCSMKEEHRVAYLLCALEQSGQATLVDTHGGDSYRFSLSDRSYEQMRLDMFSMTPNEMTTVRGSVPFLYQIELEGSKTDVDVLGSDEFHSLSEGPNRWWEDLGFVVAELAMKMITIIGVTRRGNLAYRELAQGLKGAVVRYSLCDDPAPDNAIFELALVHRCASTRRGELCIGWPIRSIEGGLGCVTELFLT